VDPHLASENDLDNDLDPIRAFDGIDRLIPAARRTSNEINARGGFCHGLLADQITGVLPRIKQKYDVALSYADVTEWELPIKSSNIAIEIVEA
jgi:hypothetical protein